MLMLWLFAPVLDVSHNPNLGVAARDRGAHRAAWDGWLHARKRQSPGHWLLVYRGSPHGPPIEGIGAGGWTIRIENSPRLSWFPSFY
jgi:hypothetical protein